ncbi:adenosylmethionine decarboxylase [Apibacter muscae]|uniref:adenosylmethionine decarboxylase n=1 Tax=Apibacter muscae TaxID=2509004 RepID=UPI0011AC2475|nr:adenosylmethionine decarboxylase [Apibacter muscae]TWP24235.1 adenosylmethionine decarboxylase [Apibacter muscae]
MVGKHFILDVFECDERSISFVKSIQELCNNLVKVLELKKVEEAYKQFQPVGVTGILLLEESHLSIHTWPEKRYAALDVFSCRPFDVTKVEGLVIKCFKTKILKPTLIDRG